MKVVICPGAHAVQTTAAFLAEMGDRLPDPIVYPADRYPPYSPQHLLDFLYKTLPTFGIASTDLFQVPLIWIGFSAGVVGAIGAARQWQRLGGKVVAFVAIDGWGVPLYGDFPIYRISHDAFTHWSSAILGASEDSFYADPPVAHLELWRSPQTVQGWWMKSGGGDRIPTTAAQFLLTWLDYHAELNGVGDFTLK
jgi:hypothetical protein